MFLGRNDGMKYRLCLAARQSCFSTGRIHCHCTCTGASLRPHRGRRPCRRGSTVFCSRIWTPGREGNIQPLSLASQKCFINLELSSMSASTTGSSKEAQKWPIVACLAIAGEVAPVPALVAPEIGSAELNCQIWGRSLKLIDSTL